MKKTSTKIRQVDVESIKFMIAAFSLTATLAFWGMFSAKDQRDLVYEAQNPQPGWAINLPPVPTVVAAGSGAGGSDPQSSQPAQALRSVTQPKVKFSAPSGGSVIIKGGGGGSGSGSGSKTKPS
ncbi:MAG: hypothetical protein OEY93_09370 [Anaerolineae bacterium]|nr:hypothetical protein [Anaerolineae bacterium]